MKSRETELLFFYLIFDLLILNLSIAFTAWLSFENLSKCRITRRPGLLFNRGEVAVKRKQRSNHNGEPRLQKYKQIKKYNLKNTDYDNQARTQGSFSLQTAY